MTAFDRVAPSLAQALSDHGYETLTPVQLAVLEPETQGEDLLVSAQTGSGKTVAFGMAIAPTLLVGEDCFSKADAPVALVIAPTRELALQVKRELEWLYAPTGAVIASCVGGMDIRTERRALARGAHIIVGTPGRLRDHITRNALQMDGLKAVVLDEADEMLDLGFREDLEFMLEAAPQDRRTLLFSATVAPPIAKLAKRYQRDAIRISTKEEQKQHGDIAYRALVVAPGERENAIINVLRFYEPENALVFCNTRAAVNHMVARFNNRGFSVVALSGELSQNERTHALQAMRDGRARVCIATDVAARGIDLPKLELVIHADLPSDPETLLHRSGRTGRAGRKGVSAMMVDQKGRGRAERLLRFAKIDAEWANPPSANAVLQRDETRLLADPILTDTANEDEQQFAERLVAQFSPEQIATAYLRLSKAGKSAPEDIRAVAVTAPSKRDFKDGKGARHEREPRGGKASREFEQSLWITLSVGRKQNAEPRWLIPLICNAGEVSKPAIGYIKIEQNQTHIELDAKQADRFLEAIGPNQTLEKNVRVKVLDAKPAFDTHAKSAPKTGGRPRFEKPRGAGAKKARKPHRGQESPDPSSASKSQSKSKSNSNPNANPNGKPKRKDGSKRPEQSASKPRKPKKKGAPSKT
ncbi:MAG: DEAD/DEAH box helicase [Pseudomonadota bacterium]